VRDPDTYGHKPKPDSHKRLSIDQKESYCWLKSLQAVNVWAEAAPETTLDDLRRPLLTSVNVGDREADIYDLFLLPRAPNVHLLVRAVHNRRVEEQETYLFRAIENTPVACTTTVHIPARAGQPARDAVLSVRRAERSPC
jgi:hypothetical protein